MRALRWIGLIVALLVVIVAAIAGGWWLGHQSAPTPTPTVTHHAETQHRGTMPWEKLRTGDCVIGYTNAWQDTYTVVSCDAAHTAQLVMRAPVPEASATYPGEKALSAAVAKLCASPKLLNQSAAREYPLLRREIAFPQTEAEWTAAANYDCFITAPAGEFLTTDLMPASN